MFGVQKRSMVRWICRFLLGGLIIGGATCLGGYWFTANLDARTPAAQTVFHTPNPREGITIPYQPYGSLILVQANIDGKEAICMVDTGSNIGLSGDSSAIEGQSLHRHITARDGDIHGQAYDQRLLKSVRLGDFEVCNVRGWRILPATPVTTPSTAPRLPIILGNAFFKDAILTIDYRAHTLLLRPSAPPPVPEQTSEDVVLDFTYDGVSAPEGWGVPCVAGTIEGKNVRCIVDTGWSLPEMGVSPAVFAGLHPAQKRIPATRSFAFGSGTVNTLPNVQTDIGGLRLVSPVLESRLLGMGSEVPGGFTSDVILGSSILQNCKVTIDYSARQIRLTAYRSGTGGR